MIQIDMVMPKSCRECMFNERGICYLLPRVPSWVEVDKYTTKRSEHCPLIETKDVPDICVGKWISVKDSLPEAEGWYLVYAPGYSGGSSSGLKVINGVMFAKWSGKSWSIEVGYHKRPGCVWYWMPLPEPPKEE